VSKRQLTVNRLYTAGQYQNLTFTDSISEIPDELVFDEEFIKRISNVMMLRLDLQERKYFLIREKTRGLTHEDAIEFLENAKAEELAKLMSHLETKKETK
jgi:hypothetical protein